MGRKVIGEYVRNPELWAEFLERRLKKVVSPKEPRGSAKDESHSSREAVPRPPSSVILFLMEYACGNISGAGGRTRTDMSSEARQILSLVRIPISPLRRAKGCT